MPRLFIFTGRSGCGKGTQANLLIKFLESKNPGIPNLHIESGKLFREIAVAPGYTNGLIKNGLESGARLPDFLAVWNWSRVLVEKFTGQENIIFDGAPRSLLEAQAIGTLINFYPDLSATVIYLNIGRETALKRMNGRGRHDDSHEDMERRLDWFEADVQPAVDFLRSDARFKFLDIDGEPPPEAIHQAIVSQL